MNYIIGILVALALVVCVFSFPVPTLVGVVIAIAWWMLRGRHRNVR